jgi:hypothetical protein
VEIRMEGLPEVVRAAELHEVSTAHPDQVLIGENNDLLAVGVLPSRAVEIPRWKRQAWRECSQRTR